MSTYTPTIKVLLTLALTTFTTITYSVEVKNWSFKGHKDWFNLTGNSIPVDYAEASVGDERLAILYDKQNRQWYMQFTYIGNRQLTHSKRKQPEFFVRTLSNSGSGRFDSDHLITHDAKVFYNDPGKPQYVIMELEPSDLPYLKVGLDVGAGYFLTDKCLKFIEGKRCLDLGEYRSYLFPGVNIAQAISDIERRNDLLLSKAVSKQVREQEFKQSKENKKIAKMLRWYQGDWAEVTPNGPRFGGCKGWREIDYDRFPNLMQKGWSLGSKHKGVLAISALEPTGHDHIYVSSAYPHLDLDNTLIIPILSKSDTKKIPLFTESGKQFYRLRLGAEIPGIPYKRIIETDGKTLRLIAWDNGGKQVKPLYFIPCK